MGNYAQWQKVNIPHTWNAEDTDDETPGYFRDKCMYKKSVVIPASKSKERVFLYLKAPIRRLHSGLMAARWVIIVVAMLALDLISLTV